MIDFLSEMDIALSGGDPNMNWSVWEHEKIRKGDLVYLLKVGYGTTGIVAKGKVTHKAYRDEDWSGKGRETYYVDFVALCMVSPDAAPILTSQRLEDNIADFDWRGGHSGMRLSSEQEARFNTLWNEYVWETFGSKPKSNPPAVFFKPRCKKREQVDSDQELTNLGFQLYNAIMQRRRHPRGYDFMLDSKQLMEIVIWLLKDAKDSAPYAYANLECANHTEWEDFEYLKYLQNAVYAFRRLKQNGFKLNVDMDNLEKRLQKREDFGKYVSEAEKKAESGEIMENLRDLIDGFDEINNKIGSFHDSELVSAAINYDEDFIELKLHMCNGADDIVTFRFEGNIDNSVSGYGFGCGLDIYWGYFYRLEDRIVLSLDPIGKISANRLRVVSIEPCLNEEDSIEN